MLLACDGVGVRVDAGTAQSDDDAKVAVDLRHGQSSRKMVQTPLRPGNNGVTQPLSGHSTFIESI